MRKLILLCSVLGIGLTLSAPLAIAQPGPGRDGPRMEGPHGPPGYNHRPPRHRHWRMRNHRRYYY